jgi:hypothetical protein
VRPENSDGRMRTSIFHRGEEGMPGVARVAVLSGGVRLVACSPGRDEADQDTMKRDRPLS